MVYTLECTRDKLDSAMDIVRDVVCRPRFFPWELEDAAPALKLDLAMLASNHQAQLVEAIHKAAYRDGLGNSLFMPDFKIGSFNEDDVLDFYLSRYVDSNMTFVSVGPSHQTLMDHAKKFKPVGVATEAPRGSGYHGGGEVRVEAASDLVHAAVVTEGAAMDSGDLAALMVLHQAMGTTPAVKYGVSSGRVGKAAAGATSNPVAASCILASYSDSGLFGFQVTAKADDADKVLKSVGAAFTEATKGALSEAEVTAAKAKVKSAFLMWYEEGASVCEDMGAQAAVLGDVASTDQVLAGIDNVTATDVNNVAKKVINSKPSMAAVGNLSNTPYLYQIFK